VRIKVYDKDTSCRDNNNELRMPEALLYYAYDYLAQVLIDKATGVRTLLWLSGGIMASSSAGPLNDTKIGMHPVLDGMRYCCSAKNFMTLLPLQYMT